MEKNINPPQSIETEEAVLGGILLDPEAYGRICEILQQKHFYLNAHRQIYRAMQDLAKKGDPTDVMSVSTWLSDHDLMNTVGGMSKLFSLVEVTVSAVNIDRYAELLVRKWQRRDIIKAAMHARELAYDEFVELPDVLEEVQQSIFDSCQCTNKEIAQHSSDFFGEAFFGLDECKPILSTLVPGLDERINGWVSGEVTVVCARPSVGKSHVGVFAATQYLAVHNKPVLFCSLEMTADQMAYRFMACLSVHHKYPELMPMNSLAPMKHRSGSRKMTAQEWGTWHNW